MIEKILWIVLANLCFYFKTLMYNYSSDDIPVFQNPPKFDNFFHKILCWLDGRYRSGPEIDHALTIALHTLVSVFIYTGFGSSDISFLAAMLFAFNPTNNQGSLWISGRSYVLAALGMTGAMTFPWICGVFLMIATYTNSGFIAPIVMLGSKWASYAWLTIPFAMWINWSRFSGNVYNKMTMEMIDEDKAIQPRKILLALKTFGFYTSLSLIPFQNAFYHSYLQSSSGSGLKRAYSLKDRFLWIGALLAGAMIWYVCTHKWDMISFSILWYCVCLAPFSNFLRMSQETAERYCYLPNCGLMFILASILIYHPMLIIFFLTLYCVRLWFLMDMYQDDYYLLEYACLQDPSSWFVWHVRALKRWNNKSYHEAVILWTMARRISPKEFKLLFNLATCCIFAGHKEEALEWIKLAEENIPPGQEEFAGRYIAEWRSGRVSIIG